MILSRPKPLAYKFASPILALLLLIPVSPIFAQFGENLSVEGLTNKEIVPFVISIINLILGFLALIVFLIILTAGFKWMVSGGDPGKIKEAQASIKAAVIGLVVVFMSWSIVTFVFGILKNASL